MDTADRLHRAHLEQRSIDYIPTSERSGTPWHTTAIWVTSTSNINVLALGTVGVLAGLSFFWSLVGIIAGALFGAAFSALHSSQGPQFGLPQMIQSRPQYGYRGASLVYAIAILAYVGTCVLTISLTGITIEQLFGIPPLVGMILFTAVGVVVAIFGYDLIRRWSRYTTIFFLVTFIILTVFLVSNAGGESSLSRVGEFSLPAFMLQVVVAAGALLGWAPYASDYTRYLPSGRVGRTFATTYAGMCLPAVWIAGLAAAVATLLPGVDIVTGFRTVGDGLAPGFGSVVLSATLLGSITVLGMSLYGVGLTSLTLAASVTARPRPASAALRAWISVAAAVLCFGLALLTSGRFQDVVAFYFSALAYALAPWTATNLTDFFLVRRGRYSIREIFNPTGIYGSWNWRGYTAYGIAITAMFPFMTTPYFSGPIGELLGFDIAPFVGIAVGALAYLVLCRSLDLSAERAVIAEADRGIDDPAS